MSPTLDQIESNLFDPSDALMTRWMTKPDSLTVSQRVALEQNKRAQELRQDWLDNQSEPSFVVEESFDPATIKLPERLQRMIEMRCNSQEQFADIVEPEAGQIRLVDRTIGPDGENLEWDMNYPLAVLLLKETGDQGIWYGWMVSRETDYATYQDVLLDEGDAPYDPLAGMVQTWNPVHIYVGSVGRVIGELSSTRLAVVGSVYTDFLFGQRPDIAYARTGTLVNRLTNDGQTVLTGSPLGTAESDPRHRYQDLYFAAAGLVKDLAKHALRAI